MLNKIKKSILEEIQEKSVAVKIQFIDESGDLKNKGFGQFLLNTNKKGLHANLTKMLNKFVITDEKKQGVDFVLKEDPEENGKYTRNKVEVDGIVYRSTKEAFKELGLPLGKHVKFRMMLKQVGTAKFEDKTFKLLQSDGVFIEQR